MKRAFLSVDLGQLSDYTALTVVERAVRPPRDQRVKVITEQLGYEPLERGIFDGYRLRHLRRFDLGTPYLEIAAGVKELQEAPQLKGPPNYVIADTTGVGLP